MSEVNGPKINFNQVNFQSTQKANEVSGESETRPQITDFSDSKAEAIGRSMLLKGSDGVNNDLKALLETPQIAENSDKVFETAYAAAQATGVANPYEEAASVATTAM